MTHRGPSYVNRPFVPQSRDRVARALVVALIVVAVANLAMTAYIFVFVRRLVTAVASLGG
jgi:hypothetical protein